MKREVTLYLQPGEITTFLEVLNSHTAMSGDADWALGVFERAVANAEADHRARRRRERERAATCAHEHPGHWFCRLQNGHAGEHRYARSRP